MKAIGDNLKAAYMKSIDAEMAGILNATWGNVGATSRCLHYCKCGMIGEHTPNSYFQTESKKCGIALNIKCNKCSTQARYTWHRFKWRKA